MVMTMTMTMNDHVAISRINVLNLTHFSHFFMKVTLMNLLFGTA